MRSEHLVDPELRDAVTLLPELNFASGALPLIRAAINESLEAIRLPDDPALRIEWVEVPGPEGAPPVRAISYRPAQPTEPLPAILHIHGGGFVMGTPMMMDVQNRAFAKEMPCAVFSVDYRLAPEIAYPGAIEDCYAVLGWMHRNAESLGIDPGRIGVKGESAGGGHAAALALLARDRGEFPLAFQHLAYPMIDDRQAQGADAHPYTGEFVWKREQNTFGWASLLGDAAGGPSVSEYAAAARATNLAGLPPAFIAVGALDLFLDENMDYALRLTRAGVPVELHLYPGAYHGFELAAEARLTRSAAAISNQALRRMLHG